MSNKINTRVQNKHDIKENWDKATNFVPLEGETIYYDENVAVIGKNLNLSRAIKVGDGVTPIAELPYLLNLKSLPLGGIAQIQVPTKDSTSKWTGQYVDCAASGLGAVALGIGTVASGDGSFAAGEGSKAFGPHSVALGLNTITGDLDGSLSGSPRSGKGAIALGTNSHAFSPYSLAFGENCQAFHVCSIALGKTSINKGQSSIAIGYNINITENAPYSIALGRDCQIDTAEGAFVAGRDNHVKSNYTVALGMNNKILATGSVALGRDNLIASKYSVALGQNNQLGVVNEQGEAIADLYSTIALGYKNIVQANYACALGVELQVFQGNGNNGQVVMGRYNVPTNAELGYAVIVGNGTELERSNCYALKRNGQAWYKGDVYVGGGGLEDAENPPKKLSTEEYVNNLIGEIDTALDEILSIQSYYINGGNEA